MKRVCLWNQLQNSSTPKIALLNPIASAPPRLPSRVGRRQRVGQARPVLRQWGPKSSIFRCRGVLQLPLWVGVFGPALLFCDEALPKRGVFVEADVLYWQADEGGLGYAVKSESADALAPKSKAFNPHFDWDFGARIAIGYRIPHDLWALFARFTLYHTHTDAHHSDPFLFPSWLLPEAPANQFASDVHMHWRLHMGAVDLVLQKTWQVSRAFQLVPQMGIRHLWARQKFNIGYEGGSLVPDRAVLLRMKNKFQGTGPYLGLKTDWALGAGFSLFGNAAASMLFGEFYLHQDEDTLNTNVKRLGFHDIFGASRPMWEMQLGLRWQRSWPGTLKRLTLEVSWDQLTLFEQNELARFTDDIAPGVFVAGGDNLNVHGVELGFRFDF